MMSVINTYALQRRARRYTPCMLILLVLAFGYHIGIIGWLFGLSLTDPHEDLPAGALRKMLKLQRENRLYRSVLKRHNILEAEYSDPSIPEIYVITPTYARPHQKAELTRLKNVFLHVPSLHWIVVEDADIKSDLVSNFLRSSGLTYTHLNEATPTEWKLHKNEPNWQKPRGVLQRNAGIKWLRRNSHAELRKGVVYFADDDNTYSIELFQEMRDTKVISVWPVGIVGGVMVERPKVTFKDHESRYAVAGWLTGWRPDRPFATDMAGFAVNLDLILNSKAEFSLNSQRGFMESDFLEQIATRSQLEPKAELCTKVYVWHTQTMKPDMKDEERLRKIGKPTDEGIEV